VSGFSRTKAGTCSGSRLLPPPRCAADASRLDAPERAVRAGEDRVRRWSPRGGRWISATACTDAFNELRLERGSTPPASLSLLALSDCRLSARLDGSPPRRRRGGGAECGRAPVDSCIGVLRSGPARRFDRLRAVSAKAIEMEKCGVSTGQGIGWGLEWRVADGHLEEEARVEEGLDDAGRIGFRR
jgi:hypothetical protein